MRGDESFFSLTLGLSKSRQTPSQVADHLGNVVVVGAGRNRVVKLMFQRKVSRFIILIHRLGGQLMDALQVFFLQQGHAVRSNLRAQRLQLALSFEQIGQLLEPDLGHQHAFSGNELHQAFGGELSLDLANGRSGDFEPASQGKLFEFAAGF